MYEHRKISFVSQLRQPRNLHTNGNKKVPSCRSIRRHCDVVYNNNKIVGRSRKSNRKKE